MKRTYKKQAEEEKTAPIYQNQLLALSEESVQDQQRKILLDAIDAYTVWRRNKEISDNRGYALKIFTKLRHYTVFGEERAHNLRKALLSDAKPDPVKLLQTHLKSNSKINNHSLDTYLIEYIKENDNLFLVRKPLSSASQKVSVQGKSLMGKERRSEIRKIIIEQESYSVPEYAYQVAQSWEQDHTKVRKKGYLGHIAEAYTYYKIAIRYDHEASLIALEKFAERQHSEAQYILGFYYHRKNNFPKAITFCLLAAERQHPKAIAYLHDTSFSAEHYLMIARKYDTGDGVKENIDTAILFYGKAFTLKNKHAAVRLGELHKPKFNRFPTEKHELQNFRRAFNYYLIAAEQGHEAALKAMEAIAEHVDDEQLWLRVGECCLRESFDKHMPPLASFKKLVDKNVLGAGHIISTLTTKRPECAYKLAKLHEEDVNKQDRIIKACFYYRMAIEHQHKESLNRLKRLAKMGISEAQYTVGFYHYHKKGKFDRAVHWCLRAANQQHPIAIAYLRDTQFSDEHYLMIARKYDTGDGVTININLAIFFYKKSFALNNKYAALRLGQLNQPNVNGSPTQLELIKLREAFNYYLVAAEQGYENALKAMEIIAEQVNDDQLRFRVGEIYLKTFAKHLPALACFKKLADKNFEDAILLMTTLTMNRPEYANVVGKLYEEDNSREDHLLVAIRYYTLAALAHNHDDGALKRLATAGDSEAQFELGARYYHRKQKFNLAIHWCLRAAEQQHPKAISYLYSTQFSTNQYLLIARKYDQGDGVVQNMEFAKYFYQKAFELNDKKAAFRLGQLCQLHPESKEDAEVARQALNYYVVAAKQKDKAALKAIEDITDQLDNDDIRFKLGQLYLNFPDKHSAAVLCFKKLADKNNAQAVQMLSQLVSGNPKYAFELAELYENDVDTENHLQKACIYYIITVQNDRSLKRAGLSELAFDKIFNSGELTTTDLNSLGNMYWKGSNGITKDYTAAIKCLEKSSIKGCEKAHYVLGNIYQSGHGVSRDFVKAARYFQLAYDKGYVTAKNKLELLFTFKELTARDLKAIASMYESGADDIPVNWPRVQMLYQRAADLGDSSAALYLGHFHQIDHKGISNDNTLAFQSYLQAAKLGNNDALSALDRLGEEESAQNQMALSQFYGSLFHYSERAQYWQSKAMEAQESEFKCS